ncbi:MAG: aminotransferase class I/II-fold pyridoxal phosphate-dependent enzyme [Candidatus Eisenbacteria bacterium]|nr:aminotransferase class I/II-fold pyridoxal phosphate-dependent enzyme [Candidatus Eisenbacteria bacterium]
MTDLPRSGPIRRRVAEQQTYAFVAIAETRARLAAEGRTVLDFTVGEPREETPEFIRDATARSIPVRTSYPPTNGTPELRQSIAGWAERRFGVSLDPDRDLLATLGSKEAIYSLASVVVEPGSRDLVLVPDPAYPVYRTGAEMAGAEVRTLPLIEDRAFLPDLESLGADTLGRTALLWVNYPNNPTGASAPAEFFARAAELARGHGFWLASDEAYIDLFDRVPSPSALEHGLSNVISIHSLSKRSAMAGFRSGFLAGDPRLVDALRTIRPSQGVAAPHFVQSAAALAWDDDEHAVRMRHLYRRKRELLRHALEARGAHVAPSDAGFFLYFRPPGEEPVDECLARLQDLGILLIPGDRFGESGRGWIRMALVPTLEECEQAARILEREL